MGSAGRVVVAADGAEVDGVPAVRAVLRRVAAGTGKVVGGLAGSQNGAAPMRGPWFFRGMIAWLMFAAYCGLAASEWLVSPGSGWPRGMIYAAVGVVAIAVNGRRPWTAARDAVRLALAAVLVIAVPELMEGWAIGHVSNALGTVAMALVPAMVVIVAAYQGSEVRRLLVPALAGLGGMLLLIPVSFPQSTMGQIALGVLIVAAMLVAIGGVWIYRLLQGIELAQALAGFCLANAAVFLVAGFFEGGSGAGWVTGLMQGMEAVLLVVLLRGMEPVRMGARWLVIPLVTIVEGAVLLRPELTMRMGIGMGLLAGGAGWLLVARRSDDAAGLSLR